MSTLLAAAGIQPLAGFSPGHLHPQPDLVIVGNAVPRHNPEAQECERLGLKRLSMPEAMARFFLAGRRPLVAAGTHGKTTTTALLAWTYAACGADPGYLIGGAPRDLPASFHRGSGPRFIIEGDEYNASYFDRGAKFLHYQPQTLILTSVEHDHADLYPTSEALHAAYAALIALLPRDGLLIACGDSGEVRALAARAPCPTVFYGLERDNSVCPLEPPRADASGSHFRLADREAGTMEITLPLWGDHNVANALAVWAAARHDQIPAAAVAAAFAGFHGVERRLDEIGTAGGVTVVEDFAHHPTAVGKTLEALRLRYPGRRLSVLYEPRSLTAGRSFFLEAYESAFAGADRIYLAPAFHAHRLAEGERLDLAELCRRLGARGVAATACPSHEDLFTQAAAEARRGDVLVTMSSGDFAGAPQKVLALLRHPGGE